MFLKKVYLTMCMCDQMYLSIAVVPKTPVVICAVSIWHFSGSVNCSVHKWDRLVVIFPWSNKVTSGGTSVLSHRCNENESMHIYIVPPGNHILFLTHTLASTYYNNVAIIRIISSMHLEFCLIEVFVIF